MAESAFSRKLHQFYQANGLSELMKVRFRLTYRCVCS